MILLQSTKTYTELELVQALKLKDQIAFSYLYNNYAGAVNGIISAIIKQHIVAEEIVQETFLKVWNNINLYDARKGRLFTWIKTIAQNLSLDTLKSKQYKQQSLIVKDETAVADWKDGTDEHIRYSQQDLKQKLNQLNSKQKQIIDLSYFHGYTQEEISRELDMPVGTVKTGIRSAIIALRKIIH